MTLSLSVPRSRVSDPLDAPPIRWGIIAPGWIAGQFTTAVHNYTRSRVAAVASSSAERAAAFAAEHAVPRWYESYEQLTGDPDVDAIYIASPHSHHHQQGLLALAAGKPVLMEKAFAQNADQAKRVIEAAQQGGLLLMEAMWTRFLPHIDVVRQLLADGSLGDVHTVISDHGQYFDLPPTHRLLNPDLAGGALLDLGVYPVSFTSFVLGAPNDVVATAVMAETGVDAQVSAVLRTGTAHGLVSATQTAKTPTSAAICGTLARVEIGGPFYAPQPLRLISRDDDVVTADVGPITGHDGLAYEAAHFATLLVEGATESPLLTLGESLSVMETMDEIRRQIGVVYPNERITTGARPIH